MIDAGKYFLQKQYTQDRSHWDGNVLKKIPLPKHQANSNVLKDEILQSNDLLICFRRSILTLGKFKGHLQMSVH